MLRDLVRLAAPALAPLALCSCAPTAARPPAPSQVTITQGAVAADHVLASEAGASVLRAGGNAVDAAVAAALSSGVVQPSGSGLGGGGFALVVQSDGSATFLDFRETAPAAATRDMYAGGTGGGSSQDGGLAVATPAEALGLAELETRFGRLGAARVAAPAIAQARDGFQRGAHLQQALRSHPGMDTLFTTHDGQTLRRPLLAKALTAWGETGGKAFRDGWVAQDFVDATTAAGGILTLADLTSYAVKERTPLSGSWHGHTVITAPPPSSGGIAILQMLQATDGVAGVPCRVEAAKHAMADRAVFGGDPDFVSVDSAALLSPARIDAIRTDCGPTTRPSDHYGKITAQTDHGTLHISVMDSSGMAVALTTTINTTFGSKVVAPRSGIVLNNEMDDFAARPGEPNAYGLIQSENNAIGPGRRPLSSMSPTVVLGPDKRPVLAVGASGGPFIITATYQTIENVLLAGLSPADALNAPRWHHQWMPDVVTLEPAAPGSADLAAAGHTLKTIEKPACAVQVVRRLADGSFEAASDPRKGGEAVIVR
ncbi:MAG: gamma-glutamyltransferase [Myxococcales bacterium]|nr:gamma-glutamyltransferase [Myxococcales bacterium]